MFKVETEITYINDLDLNVNTRNKLKTGVLDIDNISFHNIVDRELVRKSQVLILKYNGKYKILKSRY